MLIGQSIKTLESVLDLAVWLEKNGQEFYATVRRRNYLSRKH